MLHNPSGSQMASESSAESSNYGLNVLVPPQPYVETVTPSRMVFGGGAFGR